MLRNALDSNGMVRRVGIHVECFEVRFTDLDWAGFHGQACYPGFMNPNIDWPAAEGASDGELMCQEHDREIFGHSVHETVAALAQAY